MKNNILNIIKCLVFIGIVLAIFMNTEYNFEHIVNMTDTPKLVVFGDNIDRKYQPIVQEEKVYISIDTIASFIDEDIFYDSNANKVIITNEEYVYKFKINDNIATRNLQSYDAKTSARIIDDEVYMDMLLIKDIYDIKTEYDKDTNTISIDKKSSSDLNLNYNNVKVYDNIKTSSNIIDTLNKNNTVTVYTDSLKHNRWYKVKTDNGKIGYIEKSAVTVPVDEPIQEPISNAQENEKLIMFWQYGSNLDTLGEKIDGVNVVMPTWFAVTDSQGTVEINYSKDYYQKAKQNGYEIWPIITNSFDSEDADKKQITSNIVNDEQKRENLIINIVEIIKDYKLDGINIDFENMKEEDKYMYTQFLRELYPVVKQAGAKLSVDVYFTNYIDRKGVGKACDYLMLMGYDQRGNWSKEAGSIAEVSWTEKNIKSLIEDSKIDPSKIILGVPFYTRLWIIDADGDITTNVYSMKNSQDFIASNNLTKIWDEEAGQNYVEVSKKGKIYKLWIEDSTSIEKRAEIVKKYGLAGITAWQKGFETQDIWQVLYDKLK